MHWPATYAPEHPRKRFVPEQADYLQTPEGNLGSYSEDLLRISPSFAAEDSCDEFLRENERLQAEFTNPLQTSKSQVTSDDDHPYLANASSDSPCLQ